jgi:two-component system response regulator NreC
MESSAVRVLVVEDFEPFRQLIRTLLEKDPRFQIVAEASDGLDAVQKATELKPHLILLDIGLPLMNGLDAARLIHNLAPDSKILFVTQEGSADIAQEAFRLGASGYVLKMRVSSDLLIAADAVLQGKQFVSPLSNP